MTIKIKNQNKIVTSIAEKLEISPELFYNDEVKFTDLLSASPVAVNSIDLMESIAWAFSTHNVSKDIDIPAFVLDDRVSELVDFIEAKIIEEV